MKVLFYVKVKKDRMVGWMKIKKLFMWSIHFLKYVVENVHDI